MSAVTSSRPSGPEILNPDGSTPHPDRAISVLERAASIAHRASPAKAAEVTAADIASVPLVAFREHMDHLLMGKDPVPALDALLESGVLHVWIPEVAGMVGFGDGEWRHKDVWKHTKQVVMQAVPRLAVRWGALLHDIGKPKTRSIDEKGEVHFFGHSEVGASMFRRRVGDRLGFEGDLRDRVHYLILHHLRASQYDGSWTDSAVRRFTREMGDGVTDLFDLSRADITTKRPEKKKRGLTQISELQARARDLEQLDAQVPPLPKGLGNAMMEAFGVPPSKRLGEIKEAVEAEVAEGKLTAGQDAEYYIEWLRQNRSRFGI